MSGNASSCRDNSLLTKCEQQSTKQERTCTINNNKNVNNINKTVKIINGNSEEILEMKLNLQNMY